MPLAEAAVGVAMNDTGVSPVTETGREAGLCSELPTLPGSVVRDTWLAGVAKVGMLLKGFGPKLLRRL